MESSKANYQFKHGSQVRLQLSVASPTNRPQPKAIITKVMIKLKLWPVADCEAKILVQFSSPFLFITSQLKYMSYIHSA